MIGNSSIVEPYRLSLVPSSPVVNGDFARPFVKWAGGKTQIIDEIAKRLPEQLGNGKLTKYAEPFVGGGAVLFYLLQRFTFDQVYISDANPDILVPTKLNT